MGETNETEVLNIKEEIQEETIQTLGIPVLNRGDLLLRCVTSVDSPIKTLFIINNGEDKGVRDVIEKIERRDIPNAALFCDIRVEKFKNLGCARSWNHMIRTSPGAWLISGNDIQFTPGDIQRIKDSFREHQDTAMIHCMGYAVYVMTKVGVQTIGLFDENFYPAYYEDNDHHRRAALVGAKIVGVPGFKAIHGEAPNWGSCTVNSDPALAKKNAVTFRNLQDYYIAKWGGLPGKERFPSPYNRSVSMDFWELDYALRERNSIF